jgi:hypothetical protein
MKTNKWLLLEHIDASVRIQLLTTMRLAMAGHPSQAVQIATDIGHDRRNKDDIASVAAANLLICEIHHLDGDDLLAKTCFDQELIPLVGDLPNPLQLIVEQNRIHLGFSSLEPTCADRHYLNALHRRRSELSVSDHMELLYAEEAAINGRHNDALGGFWRELSRCFRQCDWPAYRDVEMRFARECHRVGLFDEAVYHAMMALDDEQSKRSGEAILLKRDVSLVERLVNRSTKLGNLCRHFCTVSEAIIKSVDCLSDADVSAVLSWVRPKCGLVTDMRGKAEAFEAAWKVFERIAPRLGETAASEMVAMAVAHPIWNAPKPEERKVILHRKELVRAVAASCKSLPASDLPSLALAAMPLAGDRRQDYDYHDTIELLCQIAARSQPETRQMIGDYLLRKENRTFLVGHVTKYFDREFLPREELNKVARNVAKDVLLEVQRIPKGGEAKSVPGTMMTMTHEKADETIVVSVTNGTNLTAVLKHAELLDADVVAELVDAAVAVATDDENLVSNREATVAAICSAGGEYSNTLAERVINAMLPIADGKFGEGSLGQSKAERNNPFTRHKFNDGDPSRLRGMALLTLATLAEKNECVIEQLMPRLEFALADPDNEVRRLAFAAARQMRRLTEAATMAVLLGMRDSDPVAASSAFFAIANKEELSKSSYMWQLFLYSARLAQHSSSVSLRREAAFAIKQQMKNALTNSHWEATDSIRQLFAADICWSVRRAATLQKSSDSEAA